MSDKLKVFDQVQIIDNDADNGAYYGRFGRIVRVDQHDPEVPYGVLLDGEDDAKWFRGDALKKVHTKYQEGDKFIVEIDRVDTTGPHTLYTAKGFRTLVFDDNGLDRLKPYKPESTHERVMLELSQVALSLQTIIKQIMNNDRDELPY